MDSPLDDLPEHGMGSQCFNREGKQISMREWGKLLEDDEYKIIARTTLSDGTWVSTVWLGLNHNWRPGPPLIFETMIKNPDGEWDVYQVRYESEVEARAGHIVAVEWRSGLASLAAEDKKD